MPKVLKFKTTFSEEWREQTDFNRPCRKSDDILNSVELFQIPEPKSSNAATLSEVKKSDIKQMLKFMPPADRAYMQLVCN